MSWECWEFCSSHSRYRLNIPTPAERVRTSTPTLQGTVIRMDTVIPTATGIHIPTGMVTLTAIRMRVTVMGTTMHTGMDTLITIRKSLSLR